MLASKFVHDRARKPRSEFIEMERRACGLRLLLRTFKGFSKLADGHGNGSLGHRKANEVGIEVPLH